MRTLKPGEIRLLCETLAYLKGARLQSVQSSKKDLILEFWQKGELYFLWYEDSPLRPALTFWPGEVPFKIKKSPLPLLLFLKAHFVGKLLQDVIFHSQYGRVMKLHFGEGRLIEFRLFPHGQNVTAQVEGKSLSLHRPKELQEMERIPSSEEELRSVEEFSHEWLAQHLKKNLGKKVPANKAEPDLHKELEKKKSKLKKALKTVKEELEKKDFILWQKAGEWLQTHQSFKDLPPEYLPLIDQRRALHWNVDQLFERAKEIKRKREGTLARIEALEKQLKELEENGVSSLRKSQSPASSRTPQTRDLKTRSLQLAPDVRVMTGKSAKDNLNLLRQAKPWDLWFHLKDIPSSHAVVFRPKKRELSGKEENQIVQWFFHQNFGKKWAEEIGNHFEVIVAECRFVKPIKGDRIGRVHYHNEKVLRVSVKES